MYVETAEEWRKRVKTNAVNAANKGRCAGAREPKSLAVCAGDSYMMRSSCVSFSETLVPLDFFFASFSWLVPTARRTGSQQSGFLIQLRLLPVQARNPEADSCAP